METGPFQEVSVLANGHARISISHVSTLSGCDYYYYHLSCGPHDDHQMITCSRDTNRIWMICRSTWCLPQRRRTDLRICPAHMDVFSQISNYHIGILVCRSMLVLITLLLWPRLLPKLESASRRNRKDLEIWTPCTYRCNDTGTGTVVHHRTDGSHVSMS